MSQVTNQATGGAILTNKSPREPDEAKLSNENGSMSPSEFFGKLQPFLEKCFDIYANLSPYIKLITAKSSQIWKDHLGPLYRKYYFAEISSIILGFVLLFFGGHFAMSIACYTALQISGWPIVVESYKRIRLNYDNAMEAFKHDKEAQSVFDKDNDGKISTEEIKDAATRWLKGTKDEKFEMMKHFRGVLISIDPKQVMSGMTSIWSVMITVLATLRSRFAKDIALGVSLGDIFVKSIARHIKPFIMKNVEDDMKQWCDFIIDTICKFIGISIALLLVRIVSAFHSSVKGGQILAIYLFQFLNNKQLLPANLNIPTNKYKNEKEKDGQIGMNGSMKNDKTNIIPNITHNLESNQFFIIVQYGLAMYGLWWQLSSGFTLNSWILRLILLPFSFVEMILSFLAAY